MTRQSQCARAAILMCVFGSSTGCISTQDVSVSEPSDLATAEQKAEAQDSVKPTDVALASDVNWDVYKNGRFEPEAYLGRAQRVCSNATSPAECPADAVDYRFTGTVWAARIEACQGKARWIWAPGITGSSTPAELAEYYFVNQITVPERPASAKIHLAADDQAEVLINRISAGSVGSTTDFGTAWASESAATVLDIAGALLKGENTIAIRAANGSGALTGNCTNCTYQQNPAGVLFCVDIRY